LGYNESLGFYIKGAAGMLAKVPSIGFFVATCFGALAIVIGAGGIYSGLFFETKDHDSQFSFVPPVIALLVGTVLIVLAFKGGSPGRSHGIVIGLRNSLIVLLAVAVALVLLLILIGPLH
jgi:hypothetical protein